MNIEQELKRHLVCAAFADLFVSLVAFLSAMFMLIVYQAYTSPTVSTLFIIGVVALFMDGLTYYQL